MYLFNFYFNGNFLDRVYVNINNSDRSGNVFIFKMIQLYYKMRQATILVLALV